MQLDTKNLNHISVTAAEQRARSEPELQAMVVRNLRASGIAVEELVACPAGVADIVSARRDVIIEIKLVLTRKQIQWGIGQVLLYRQAINPDARAIVIGYATDETPGLVEWAAAIGVEVVSWTEGVGPGAQLFASPSSPCSQPFVLHWNIQTLARSHGITRVADLARFMDLPRQGLYDIWRNTAMNVSVERLEQLAKRLGPAPDQWLRLGDWFRWDIKGRLTWHVKGVAEEVGLDAARLAFAAGLYPQQADLFWTGTAQFVFIETLARLAAALETQQRPFDVGELFVRAEK